MFEIHKEIDLTYEALQVLCMIAEEADNVKNGKKPYQDMLDLSSKYGITSAEQEEYFTPIVEICDFVTREMTSRMNEIVLYFHKTMGNALSFGTVVHLHSRLLNRDPALSKDEERHIETLLFLHLIGREDTAPDKAISIDEMMNQLRKTDFSDDYKWRLADWFSNFDYHKEQVEKLIATTTSLIEPKLHSARHLVEYCVKRLESGDIAILSKGLNLPEHENHIIFPSVIAYREVAAYHAFEAIAQLYGDRITVSGCIIYYGVLVDKIYDKRTDTTVASIDNLFAYLKAMTDMTRLRILKELTVCSMNGREIATKVGLTQATVSHHMNELFLKNFISIEKQGTSVIYSLNNASFGQLIKIIEALFTAEPPMK